VIPQIDEEVEVMPIDWSQHEPFAR
jgi:hypothetical protein